MPGQPVKTTARDLYLARAIAQLMNDLGYNAETVFTFRGEQGAIACMRWARTGAVWNREVLDFTVKSLQDELVNVEKVAKSSVRN